MTALRTQPNGHSRRTRHGAPWTSLPTLRPAQQALLCDWLRADAAERQWQSLLDIAGAQRLELAEGLLDLLLHAGALHTKERFIHAQWRVERIVWSDVAVLQEAVGLRSAATRESARQQLAAQLQALGEQEPWLESAVRHCLDSRQGETLRQARLQLLQALASWQADQRFGLRQDFAQHARGTTKAITPTEWKWLQAHVPLEALGIARFAPLLWLGGSLTLNTPGGCIDVAAAGLCGLPTRLFGAPARVRAPRRYWLIENRASFERQALAAAPGTCVVWLPGQPPQSWREAMQWLLQQAPAPADVSCDPDPAGVAIALAAGALWHAVDLPWQAHRMQPQDWGAAPRLPLSAHDHAWLQRLQADPDLPATLRTLCTALQTQGHKAEQEFWL